MSWTLVFYETDGEEWSEVVEGWLPLPEVGDLLKLSDEEAGSAATYKVVEMQRFYGTGTALHFRVVREAAPA